MGSAARRGLANCKGKKIKGLGAQERPLVLLKEPQKEILVPEEGVLGDLVKRTKSATQEH